MTKISQLSSIGDSLAVNDQFLIRDVDDATTPNKSVTVSGITRALDVGSATAPAIAFATDKNTGIYSPGADQVAISTNGLGRLFVDASGNVGVGAASPSAPITFGKSTYGSFDAEAFYRIKFQDAGGIANDVGIGQQDSNSLGFNISAGGHFAFYGGSSNGERLRITSAGLVGIGTTSPGTALDVNGAAKANYAIASGPLAAYASSSGGLYSYFSATAGTINAVTDNSGTAGTLIFATGSERARIDSSGRLLLGASAAVGTTYAGSNKIQLHDDGVAGVQIFTHRSTGSEYPAILELARSRGSLASPTAVVADDKVGACVFHGYDGTNYIRTAAIDAVIDGTPGTNDMPGRLVFSTTADGASSPTERLRIDSAGQIEAGVGGSASVPTYSWLSDTDTGIYSPGANQLAFATGGTGRVFVDANGRVGIGVSNPAVSLDISSATGAYLRTGGSSVALELGPQAGSTGPGIEYNVDGTTWIRGRTDAFPLAFKTNNLERLRIDSSGRLLVGTSAARTFVGSAIYIPFQVEGANNNDSRGASLTYGINNTAGPLLCLAKHRSNSVGGTTVVASGDETGAILFHGSDGTNLVQSASIYSFVDGTPGANDMPGRLVFSTTADGASSPTERLRIDGAGRVGIGANAPSALLHLKGSPSAIIHLQPANDTVSNYITFRNAADATRGYVEYNYASDYLALATAVGERLRIDSSGRLLLGTSTARSNVYGITPYFQAEGANGNSNRSTSVIYGENGIGGPLISLGKHRAATVGGVTVVNSGDELGQIVFTGADGTNFVQAATIKAEVDGTPGTNDMPGRLVFSTTSDGASSPTERMRLTQAGVMLVGTTVTPTGASSGTIVAQNKIVVGANGAGRHQNIVGTTGVITASTGTAVFNFSCTPSLGRAASIKLWICSSAQTSGNTASNYAVAQYTFQLHQTTGNVISINGATTLSEYTFVRATHLAFADLGNSTCNITLTNPTAVAQAFGYQIEILDPNGTWQLASVSVT